MKLTKEQAITEHRKMWNWIADQIEYLQTVVDIHDYKKEYCVNHKFYDVLNWCFLCDYTDVECDRCPLKWPSNLSFPCEGRIGDSRNLGLWWKCKISEDWQEQAALARQIANLPERNIVMNI